MIRQLLEAAGTVLAAALILVFLWLAYLTVAAYTLPVPTP